MTIDEAIKTAKAQCKNQAAQIYLNHMPEAIEEYGSEGFRTQLLYALTNMRYWRGETARQVKDTIKTYLKENKV